MCRVLSEQEILSISFRTEHSMRNQILVGIDGPVVDHGERGVPRRILNRSPEVDDLETALEGRRSLIRWEMAVDARNGPGVRLVSMRVGGRLALLRVITVCVRVASTNS
jgi:hypothetical protein